MSSLLEPRAPSLEQRLSEAEATIEALLSGQVDAVVDVRTSTPLLLSEAQAALRESEKRYRRIVETTNEGVWLIDAENKTTFMNRRMAQMLGCEADMGLGRTPAEFMREDEAHKLISFLEAPGEHKQVEVEYTRPDGTSVMTLVETSKTFDSAGRYEGSFAMVRDITERKQAAQALQTSMETFRTLAEAMPQIVWIMRPDGWITYINQQFVDYTGLTIEESLGPGWTTPFHADDRQRARDTWQLATATVGPYSLECRLRRADGVYRWWLVRGVPLKDAAGQVLKWFGTCTDIDSLKLAELEVSRTNRALRMLSACHEARTRAGSERGLLDTICRIAVEKGGYRMAWVGFVEDVAPRSITPQAWAGFEQGYLSEIRVSWDESERLGQGPSGRAVRTGRAIVCEDLARDTTTTTWLDQARQRGYRGLVCLPLRNGQRVIGLMSLYTAEVKETSAEELELLQQMADDVASGLTTLRAETERQRIEEELRESRSFLEQAQAVGHIGSWLLDPDGTVWASEETKRILGIAGGTLERLETFGTLVHPEDVEAVREALVVAFRGGPPYNVEYRIVHPDGAVRVLHDEGKVITDEAGHALKIVGVVQDITERSAAEERLRASEERYRILFDESPMPMWAYDPETLQIVMANEAVAEQYGYSTEELMTLTLPDIRPSEVSADAIRGVNRALLPGRQHTGIWEHRRKDGSRIEVDVHLNDVHLFGRRLKLAVLHDVTRRRSLEEQLRQSQKMEAVGTLAGGVAHDFNNLLTVILGYTEILVDRFQVDAPQLAQLQEIQRAGERAAALTRQLLAFSRKQVLVPEALDLGTVVRGSLLMLERLIGEHITVRLLVAPDLGPVLADPGQMEQVVMNLAVNARDAMPRGGELLIALENLDVDEEFASEHIGAKLGPCVRLTVTDTGVGMSPAVQEQIFEPFFTTKSTGEGTGLGLSTVFGIVTQSDGAIWVKSELGGGTAFTICLPRVAGSAKPATSPSGSQLTFHGSGTILLVEDEDQLRRLARGILELKGYTVLPAGSATEAMRIAREHKGPIHLLVTDVVMPGMSGPGLAALLLRERPGVPVLYMSGYTDDAMVQHGILNDGMQFIQKPFTPLRLAQRVREAMSGGEPSPASRSIPAAP